MNLPLFDPIFAGEPSLSGPPLSGNDLRESGMASVLSHTPIDYKEKFLNVIRSFPRGFEFTVEEVRKRAGEPPLEVHRNCLGGLIHNAAKKNLIELTDHTRVSERTTRRAGRLSVWRRV